MKTKGISREGFRRYFENKIKNPIQPSHNGASIVRQSKIARESRRVFVSPWELVRARRIFPSLVVVRIDIPRPSRNLRSSIGFINASVRGTWAAPLNLEIRICDVNFGYNPDGTLTSFIEVSPIDTPMSIQKSFFPDGLLFARGQGVFIQAEVATPTTVTELYLSALCRFEDWS